MFIRQLPTEFKNSIIMENQQAPNQQVFIQQAPAPKSNGIGTAGFVLALIGIIILITFIGAVAAML